MTFMTRAVVVHPALKEAAEANPSPSARDPRARLEEAVGLARALELEIVHTDWTVLNTPRPGTLYGMGKVDELKKVIEDTEAELAIVDAPLSPVQQRNLEKAWNIKVLDRTGLILEIFGDRARTREGVLQVELAHLEYQKGRLVRSWTHLERQRGGVGFMGGPGETQIEADRRQLGERIALLKKRLEKVARTRGLHRAKRAKAPYPVVALVGYTNAGKSTLFNRLTESQVLAKDMLFATLDPTMRKVRTPRGRQIILSDTVGFVSELPTQLVAAFRATLEEVLAADVIVHVRDIADGETEAQRQDVDDVLKGLGLTEKARERMIEARNKIDLLSPEEREAARAEAVRHGAIALSAVSGEGVDDLLAAIERRLSEEAEIFTVSFAPDQGAAVAWLYEQGCVVDREQPESGESRLTLSMTRLERGRFEKRFGEDLGATLRAAAE